MNSSQELLVWIAIVAGSLAINWFLASRRLARWQYGVFAVAAAIGAGAVTHFLQPWHHTAFWHQPLWVAFVGLSGGQLSFALRGRNSRAAP